MQGKGSAFCGSATSLEVRYTGKPVSGWGGLVAVMRYLEKLGVRQVLAHAGATPFRWTVLGLRLDFLFAESFRN
jgi:hypothetical protein